jgi:LmbE family N-acetylglucosaminyl deacetylase
MDGTSSLVGAGEAIVAALRARRAVSQKVIIVAAHPDDETIGMGAQLCHLDDALLVHVTDGAPRDGEDMTRYGFVRPEDYAAARRAELMKALETGGARAVRTTAFDIPDKQTYAQLAGLAQRLAQLLSSERPAAVFTHAYEGGHPDHDAAAFAVHAACRMLGECGVPPVIEVALYHRRDGRPIRGEFLERSSPRPEPDTCVAALALSAAEKRRKQQMIDCFATQRWLLVDFPLDYERLRLAPTYDFRKPPHEGVLHYETFGWDITGAQWRQRAAAALAELGLAER